MTDISYFIRPKSVPLKSIALAKVDQNMPSHHFICACDMCNNYEAKKISELSELHTRYLNEKISQRVKHKHQPCTPYYLWAIKHLLIPQNKMIRRGLDIFIAQILFYKDGQTNNLFCTKQLDEPIIKRVNKQKLNHNFVLKVFGDRRRKYRQNINTFLGKKKQVTIKKPKFGAKKQIKRQSKDAVVIKYLDGLQQLISEVQFLNLLQKRKQDPIWKQIYYIKNYINVDDYANRTVVARFNSGDIKYQQMHKRAQLLMKAYGLNIHLGDKNYISDEQQQVFCKQLVKQSLQIYSQYLLYKIVCYIQFFYDEKIQIIVAKFLINQMGQGYLQNVIKLQTQSLIKFQWTTQTYKKKIDQQQQRVFFTKKVQESQNLKKNSALFQAQMKHTYQKMKQFFGLSMQQEDDYEERANNEFFKLIHPQIENPISQILKNKAITIQKFKRDYLGYKPKKKPIIKPFNSNLIKSLHNMTPQFHRAQPHQYLKTPVRSVSTAFTRSSSQKRKSHSYYKNYSTNPTALSTPRDY